MRCELLPELGGCVLGLWRGEEPLLRTAGPAPLQSARQAGSYPLVPYSNRIGNSQFQWQGKTYTLPLNNAPEPHVIHGVGFERAWTAEEVAADRAVLTLRHPGDASWPFAFDAQQTFSLRPDGLEMALQITNTAPHVAPVGLGWHPFFVKRAGCHIAFAAQGRWEMGADKLPTHCSPQSGLNQDCTELTVDHCFEGWDGLVLLSDARHRLRIESSLGRLVVFTTPQRDSIAIEPVSHVNNALGLASQDPARTPTLQQLGVQCLQSGEHFSSFMRIHVAPVP